MTDKIRTALNRKLDITTVTPKTKTRTPYSKTKQDRKDLYTGMPVLVKIMTEGNAAEAEKAAKEFMKMHNIGLEVDSKEFLVGIKRLESGGFELQFADNTGALLEPQNELTTDPSLGGQFLYSQFKESGTDGQDYSLTYDQVNKQFKDARITSDTINLEPFSVKGDIPEFAEGATTKLSEFTFKDVDGGEISIDEYFENIDTDATENNQRAGGKNFDERIQEGLNQMVKQALDAGGYDALKIDYNKGLMNGEAVMTYDAGGVSDTIKIPFPKDMTAAEFIKNIKQSLLSTSASLEASKNEQSPETEGEATALKGDLDDVLGLFESS